MKKKKFLYFLIALYLVGCNGVYKYDNEKAVEYITEHKEQKSKCMCAWYSMKAIRNGGCYNCYIYPAYSYNKMLVQLGFEEVFNGGNYTPLKGDISVLPRNSHSVFGHIAIYNVFPFIQNLQAGKDTAYNRFMKDAKGHANFAVQNHLCDSCLQ